MEDAIIASDDSDSEESSAVAVLPLLDDLFGDHPESLCKTESQAYRIERGIELSSPSLVYNEVPLRSFLELLTHVKTTHGFMYRDKPLHNGGRFVDAGSGAGKLVFAAAIAECHDFASCTGVEILEPLYGMSLELLASWQDDIAPVLPAAKQGTELRFVLGDMLLTDDDTCCSADVVFANSSTFDDDTMEKLSDYAMDLSKGAIFMTASQPLQDVDEVYALLEVYEMQVPFGTLSIYIQRKLQT